MKAGADDFVTKPYEPDHFRFLVQRILERRRLIDELEQLRKQMRADYSFHNMVSKSPKMRKIFDLIEQVGPLGSTVLIYGETGTGKELVAQAIHAADSRRKGPFVALELRGPARLAARERAVRPRAGRVHRRRPAEEGAVRDRRRRHAASSTRSATSRRRCRRSCSASCRPGTFERVGGTETIKVDVRIIAASNKRLEDEVKAGRFRSDLFYRLNVDPDRPAAAPRPPRGHPAAGDALPREVHADEHPAGHRDRLRGDAGAAGAHLARARPRAGERDQGGRGDGRRHGHPPRRPARHRRAPARGGRPARTR